MVKILNFWGLNCTQKERKRELQLFEFFHNFRLIRRIQQNKIYKKFRDLTMNWTQIPYLDLRHLNHYTKLFSVLVWGHNWMLFMHGWFCPIGLIHLIGRKSLHFGKTSLLLFMPPSVKVDIGPWKGFIFPTMNYHDQSISNSETDMYRYCLENVSVVFPMFGMKNNVFRVPILLL